MTVICPSGLRKVAFSELVNLKHAASHPAEFNSSDHVIGPGDIPPGLSRCLPPSHEQQLFVS